MKLIEKLILSESFEKFIITIIALNAITLGIETNKFLSPELLSTLKVLDQIFLAIFVFELVLKIIYFRLKFFTDSWRIFDFIIVALALIPATGPLSVLRSLRVLRGLRMISTIPSLKRVVSGLLDAIPGLSAVAVIIGLIFYVASVMATELFGTSFPQWFGSIGQSGYSLFQIMTLESWSMGIVRPVMEKYTLAWIFFIPFILITSFTMLNLFIAVIVNSMQAETEEAAQERADQGHDERVEMANNLKDIKEKLNLLTSNFSAENPMINGKEQPPSLRH